MGAMATIVSADMDAAGLPELVGYRKPSESFVDKLGCGGIYGLAVAVYLAATCVLGFVLAGVVTPEQKEKSDRCCSVQTET